MQWNLCVCVCMEMKSIIAFKWIEIINLKRSLMQCTPSNCTQNSRHDRNIQVDLNRDRSIIIADTNDDDDVIDF